MGLARCTTFATPAPLQSGAVGSGQFRGVQLSCMTQRRPRNCDVARAAKTRPSTRIRLQTSQQPPGKDGAGVDDEEPRPRREPPRREPPLFVDDYNQAFWDSADVSSAFAPLRPEEEAVLRARLPRRLAEFLIDRAGDAARLRQPRQASDRSFVGQMLSNLPPDTPDWEDPVNAEYRDYVYVTTVGPPSFRRKGSSVLGGSDGLPDPDENGLIGRPYVSADGQPVIRPPDRPNRIWSQPRLVSLFVGEVDSIDEQASNVFNGILAIIAFSFFLKVVFGVISFFLSFTFSFFAIFALSAGLFVLFFFLRF